MRTRRPARQREVSCLKCGALFLTRHSQGKYCSPECSRLGERDSWAKYGKKTRESRRAYGVAYYLENRSTIVERIRAYRATPAGKRMQAGCDARRNAKWPQKVAARQAVADAIKKGLLVRQPCAACGREKAHAHHPDYTKPLDVEWLCPRCHTAEHKLNAPFHPYT